MGNGSKRVPCGHLHKVQSELELGAFTEYNDRDRELYDNKSEWERTAFVKQKRHRELSAVRDDVAGELGFEPRQYESES